MKICIVTLAEKGGMIHYVSQLSDILSKTNTICIVAPEKVRGDFNNDVNIIRIPVPTRYFSLTALRFDILLMAIERTNPDVVHITIMHPWLIFALPFLRKYPLVVTIHDVRLHPGEWHPVWALSLWMLIKYTDRIFVHGSWAMNTLVNGGVSEDRISVIPHGDYSFFTKYCQKNIKETNTVLFFGRIVDYKGLEYLIKAEPFITEKEPDAKIIIAGEGDFGKYSKLIKNTDAFEIHNRFIPDEEVPNFFQRAKVIVLPYTEGTQTGIIPIAYAFKKPVVVTNIGSIHEVVENGKTGFIVPPRDENALADAITNLLKNDELRKQMGENAYKKMEDELSWNNIAEKTIRVYKEAIGDKTCK
jgi:glycosyltransferase involved in cell wall biosynthesis